MPSEKQVNYAIEILTYLAEHNTAQTCDRYNLRPNEIAHLLQTFKDLWQDIQHTFQRANPKPKAKNGKKTGEEFGRKISSEEHLARVIDLEKNRPNKKLIRSMLVDDIVTGHGDIDKGFHGTTDKQGLRALTLPGTLGAFEFLLLDTAKAENVRVEEIVCVEREDALIPSCRKSLRNLHRQFPDTKLTLIHSKVITPFVPERSPARDTLRPQIGFDYIWLDFMAFWDKSVAGTLTNLCSDARELFQRPWARNRPAFLDITLSVGRERGKEMDKMYACEEELTQRMCEATLNAHGAAIFDTKDTYKLRAQGICAFINQHLVDQHAFCEHRQFHVGYKEPDENGKNVSMFLARFKISPSEGFTNFKPSTPTVKYIGFSPKKPKTLKIKRVTLHLSRIIKETAARFKTKDKTKIMEAVLQHCKDLGTLHAGNQAAIKATITRKLK